MGTLGHQIRTVARTLQTGQFWYLFPHHLYRWRRNRDVEQTAPVSTVPYGERDEVPELHLLTGASSIGDLLFSAKSFVVQYKAPLTVVIHGDGSLGASEVKRLHRHMPQAEVFPKRKRDDTVQTHLENKEAEQCLAFRRDHVLSYKLLDVSILAQARHVIVIDTDCLAFRPLSHVKKHVAQHPDAVGYMKDPQAWPYSVSQETAEQIIGTTLTPHVNSGLVVLPRSSVKIEQIEYWLADPAYSIESHFAEQTLFGFLASVHPSEMFSPQAYRVGRPADHDETAFVHYAAHYLSATRVAMRRDGQKRILHELS